MTLENLVDIIFDIHDEDLVIFQENKLSINSDVVLFNREDDSTIRFKDNVKYVYFLELELAKEFISDWIANLSTTTNSRGIALRLLQYAIYDV